LGNEREKINIRGKDMREEEKKRKKKRELRNKSIIKLIFGEKEQ
jgi:hypothetical protein